MPVKPMKAMDSNPAVIKAIGAPLTALGSAELSSLSRSPAKRIIAKVKPMALAKAKQDGVYRL